MKKLLLDKTYDLYLTMTWTLDPNQGHGISGHIYEIIEYYLLLRNKFKVGILICEGMEWNTFEKAITSKYEIENEVLEEIRENTIFEYQPKIVKGNNILFVDGSLTRTMLPFGIILIFKNIFSFRCSNKDFHYNLPYKNINLLQDQRVYNDEDSNIAINYKKKILFNKFKKIKNNKTDTAMVYITSNCRKICSDQLLDIVMGYNFKKYIVLTNKKEEYIKKFKDIKNVSFPDMPVENIFEKFDTFIYTPTYLVSNPKHGSFDCSPRFIAECKHYNKEVLYHNIDKKYLEIDTGLKYRKQDIETNFDSIVLNEDDEIIDILRNEIQK